MNKEQLRKLIRDSIQTVANEQLAHFSKQQSINNTDKFLNSDSISEEDFDSHFFYGGGQNPNNEKKKNNMYIKESVDSKLKITSNEIKDFENGFKPILDLIPGSTIVFDKQPNGYSLSAVKRQDGVEAKASGLLNLGDNGKLTWSFSILNGFNINAQNLKMSDGNKTMFETLTNHYNDWQREWRDKLNLPTAPTEQQGENKLGTQTPSSPALGGLDATGSGPSAGLSTASPVTGGGAPAPAI